MLVKAITLTTDFGLDDWFVGTMKGVIHGVASRSPILDITHGVPRGDVRAGAFALAAAYHFFPRGTIHVAVVDPGVGGQRAAIAVRTVNYLFVGPDNGVLSWALARERAKEIRRLENERFFLKPLSQTFHGRDVFAPVAAHLARGLSLRRLGPLRKDWVRLEWPVPSTGDDELRGEVIYIDRFGNAITTIAREHLERWPGDQWRVSVPGRPRLPVVDCYAAVAPGHSAGIIGSSGLLEIAVNGGSAAETLDLKVGDAVKVRARKRR